MEEYSIQESVAEGFDPIISIKLKQYRDYGTKTCKIKFASSKPKAAVTPARPADTAPAAKSYTVVKGDCPVEYRKEVLWKWFQVHDDL